MILTENFFSVCQTAIKNSTWSGEDCHKVARALDELERLHEYNKAKAQRALADENTPLNLAEIMPNAAAEKKLVEALPADVSAPKNVKA